MLHRSLIGAVLAAVLSAGAAFAQTAAPAPAAGAPAPAATAPAATARTAPRNAPAALPAGTKVNLNTAPASELDSLPQIGKARTKVIMDERAKSPFKDWADFDKRTQHTSVNAGVKARIRDSVTF